MIQNGLNIIGWHRSLLVIVKLKPFMQKLMNSACEHHGYNFLTRTWLWSKYLHHSEIVVMGKSIYMVLHEFI
jgi:hypothetical protein